MNCKFDFPDIGCTAAACYSGEKCGSRDEDGNPRYVPSFTPDFLGDREGCTNYCAECERQAREILRLQAALREILGNTSKSHDWRGIIDERYAAAGLILGHIYKTARDALGELDEGSDG